MVQVQGNNTFKSMTDLDPVLDEIFYQHYEQVQPILLNTVIGVRTSTKAKETDQRIGSFEEPQVWKGQVYYSDAEEGYQAVYNHNPYTLGFKIDQQMFEDMQYEGIFDSASALGQSFARKRIRDAAAIFQNAFSVAAANAGYDGKPLVATDHPRSKTDATTVSNSAGTKALTSANLEDAIVQLEGLGDDRGNETLAMPNLLVVGRQQRKTALELTGSELTPESGNNAVNVHAGMQTLVHPMISGKKWFVVDTLLSLRMCKWYNRVLPAYAGTFDAGNTLVRSWYGRMRYSVGWSDFRWVVGSNPS